MNILYILTKLDRGDRAEDVIKATRFFMLNGHKTVVVSRGGERTRKIDEVGARHYVAALRHNIFSILADIFKLSQIIARENIQVVHAMDGISSFIAFFASRKNGCSFVSTIYGCEGRFFDKPSLWARRIVLSHKGKAPWFKKRGIFLQNKLRLIPPAVEIKSVGKLQASSEPDSERRFSIVATLPLFSHGATQDFMRAVSVLTRLTSKISVSVIGKTYAHFKGTEEKLELLIKRHLLGGVVRVSGEDEQREQIAKADLFVCVPPLPCDRHRCEGNEGVFSRALLEAASWGVPVIVQDADWIRDYVECGKTAFVSSPRNPEEMASAMYNLYKNKELRIKIAREAVEFVKEKFDVKKIMTTLLQLYEECISCINILVIKIGALGDVILAVPSLRAIREKFPKAKIKLLTAVDKREIFARCPFIDEVIVCDFRGRDKTLGRFLDIASRLRYEDFDIVVDLQNNKRSHLLSFLSCAPKRYGYDNGKLSFLLNRKVKQSALPQDPILHQSRVLGLLGIYNVNRKLEIWPSEEDENWVCSFLESHWVKNNTKLVAVSIGSSRRWVTKLWPPEYFAEVANTLAGNLGVRIILIGLEDNDWRTECFLKRTKCKPINALGKTTIPRLAALMKRCSVVLCSDSAPLHVATSVGTPFVGLFGPTDPLRHLASLENSIVLRKDFKCSPCYKTHCRRDYKCMKAIKPDEVYGAIVKLLNVKDTYRCLTSADSPATLKAKAVQRSRMNPRFR